METNRLPRYDMSDNPTHCCPRFHPEGWDGQELHFEAKLFVEADTFSLFHIPLNMGSVFPKTFKAIEDADAFSAEDFIVLSRDRSPWKGEHYFSVTRDVPGEKMVRLSGDYLTKVFEGPYKAAKAWMDQMRELANTRGFTPEEVYFFYTACPKCAKYYGKNYIVGVVRITKQ